MELINSDKQKDMKKIFRISMALPVVLLLAGCSSEEAPAPVQNPEQLDGYYDVLMTVATDDTRAVGEMTGSAQDNAFNEKRLYFGTFNEDGSLKHWLYEAGNCNPDPDLRVRYYLPSWGPTVAANLPFSGYKDKTFYVGAFSVPEKMSRPTLALADLGNADFNTLNWPGTAAGNYVWTPTSDKNGTDHIPMAGVMKIETSLMSNYNSDINQYSPFRLPDITFTRAMAKIVIEDLDGIIETATLKTPEKGKLLPYLPSVLNTSVAMLPAEPAGGKGRLLDQKLTAPTETVDNVKRYVFYTYEWSFLEYGSDGVTVTGIKGAEHNDRKIITLTANQASGLQGTSRATTTISFAPHSAGIPNGTMDLRTADNGLWQGVMRNTVYTFRLSRPSTGGVTVEVTATPWVKNRETFEF